MKKYNVTVNGKTYEVEVEEIGNTNGTPVPAASAVNKTSAPAPKANSSAAQQGTAVSSPMPGTILDIKVSVSQKVTSGTVLCVLEAMKMENDIVAPVDGTVTSVNIQKGSSVNSGDLLFTIA
ncbi:MAG: biotin/lipoyl-binding protein [Clostridia bacterium]|nr:biotin/lipoyl-binding protein [Clostridia bacterium]